MAQFEVIVGNIGTVYRGSNFEDAKQEYDEYANQSDTGYGRAAGEEVVLMKDGDPIRSYDPTTRSKGLGTGYRGPGNPVESKLREGGYWEREGKLDDWARKYNLVVGTHKSGARWIPDQSVPSAARTELFRLADHVVSSVIGGTIWLVPVGPATSMMPEGKLDKVTKKLIEAWDDPSPDPNHWNPAVIDLKALGLELLDWHGGQGSALYAVGSSLFAGRPATSLPNDLFRRAISELGFDSSNPEVQTLIKKLKYVSRDPDQYESTKKLREDRRAEGA